MVTGWKQKRKDSDFYKFSSKIANTLTGFLTGVKVHDMNNGFKAYKSHVAKGLHLKGGYFRFIPFILTHQGYCITEVSVEHRKRNYGKGKFSFLSRLRGLFDLVVLVVTLKTTESPIRTLGWLSFALYLKGLLLFVIALLLHYALSTFVWSMFFAVCALICFIVGFCLLITGVVMEYLNFSKKK